MRTSNPIQKYCLTMDAVLLGQQCLMFRKIIVPSSSEVNIYPWAAGSLKMMTLFLQDVTKNSPSNTVSHA
jgi:hypothetical protein